MEDLYCKVLVNSNQSRSALVAAIATALGGVVDGNSVIAPSLEADVRQNEDWDPSRYAPNWENFVFSRYYLDVEPRTDVDHSRYVAELARLLEALWASGADAISACSFEEELPWRGGIARPSDRSGGSPPSSQK